MEQAKVQHSDGAHDPLARMARRNRLQMAQQQASFQAALSQAFGRMCADYPGLHGTVEGVTRRKVSLPELVDMTEPGIFLALLDGPQDAMGMVWVCPAALAALVEAQTTGEVMPSVVSDGPPRLPTRTDAALIAPMVGAFLQHAAERCADLPEGEEIGGYQYGSFLDDRRPMGVVLEDVDYSILQLGISLGHGTVTGCWTLVLPCVAVKEPAAQAADTDDWERRLADTVENSPVELNALLCRFKLSLKEALGLAKGDVLRVPASALETLGLSALGGAHVATGRLGQARGFRAVRLTMDPRAGARGDAFSAPTLRLSKEPGTASPPLETAPQGSGPQDTRPDPGVHAAPVSPHPTDPS